MLQKNKLFGGSELTATNYVLNYNDTYCLTKQNSYHLNFINLTLIIKNIGNVLLFFCFLCFHVIHLRP